MGRSRSIPFVAAFALVAAGSPGQAQVQQKNAPQKNAPDRVGRVMVEGNCDTPDWAILWWLDQQPGQVLDRARVAAARASLNTLGELGLFDTDQPPTVEIQPNELDSSFRDIVISIRERPWNWAIFATYETAVGASLWDFDRLGSTAVRVRDKVVRWLP